MTDRVSAADLPAGKRISAARLTPTEREELEKEGRISPDGFVDIAPPAAPQMIDIRAEARKEAVAALRSVENVPPLPGVKRTEGVATESMGKLHDEIAKLSSELEARQNCPRCGLSLKEKYEVEPTKEDIEEFLKCVLAGEVFTKEYTLFGGRLKVKLRTRTGAEDEAIKKALIAFFKDSQGASDSEILSEVNKYSLATALCSYGDKEYPGVAVENFRASADERISAIPAQIQGFLKAIMQEFNILVDRLTARAQDASFWTGTAG
jgi:hypothetical protein